MNMNVNLFTYIYVHECVLLMLLLDYRPCLGHLKCSDTGRVVFYCFVLSSCILQLFIYVVVCGSHDLVVGPSKKYQRSHPLSPDYTWIKAVNLRDNICFVFSIYWEI